MMLLPGLSLSLSLSLSFSGNLARATRVNCERERADESLITTELAENDDGPERKIGKDSWIDGVSSGNIDADTALIANSKRPLFDGN
jgi:hypothetical protein